MAVNKVYPDAKAALAGLLHNDMTIMSGGFGLCGIPSVLIEFNSRQRRDRADCDFQQCGDR